MSPCIEVAAIRSSLPEIEWISDVATQEVVVRIFQRALEQSNWECLDDVPKSPELPRARSLMTHTRSVTRIARSVADTIEDLHDLPVDRNLLYAACLLHDVSKLLEFVELHGTVKKGKVGTLYQHGFLGAHWLEEEGASVELVHAVLVHTPVSNVVPSTTEALIVHYADFVDSDVQLLDAGQQLFCKRK